jgi:hypothetical protein
VFLRAAKHFSLVAVQAVRTLFDKPNIQVFDLLKVVLLYALRYETNPAVETRQFIDLLAQRGLEQEKINVR